LIKIKEIESRAMRAGNAPSAANHDLAVSVDDLYAGRRIIGARNASRSTNCNRPPGRSSSDSGITHRRERPPDPRLGVGEKPALDAAADTIPAQPGGEGGNSGCEHKSPS
jgi:hypothetical protein